MPPNVTSEELDKLASELFHTFSRIEYALKSSGFNDGDGPAKANWRNFALAVESLIATPHSVALINAIKFIMEKPPKKQVILDHKLKWEVAEPSTDSKADKLLLYVRRIRNNLFHGGKFNGHWFEPERSKPLLQHSLVVLHECIDYVEDVKKAYED